MAVIAIATAERARVVNVSVRLIIILNDGCLHVGLSVGGDGDGGCDCKFNSTILSNNFTLSTASTTAWLISARASGTTRTARPTGLIRPASVGSGALRRVHEESLDGRDARGNDTNIDFQQTPDTRSIGSILVSDVASARVSDLLSKDDTID